MRTSWPYAKIRDHLTNTQRTQEDQRVLWGPHDATQGLHTVQLETLCWSTCILSLTSLSPLQKRDVRSNCCTNLTRFSLGPNHLTDGISKSCDSSNCIKVYRVSKRQSISPKIRQKSKGHWSWIQLSQESHFFDLCNSMYNLMEKTNQKFYQYNPSHFSKLYTEEYFMCSQAWNLDFHRNKHWQKFLLKHQLIKSIRNTVIKKIQ